MTLDLMETLKTSISIPKTTKSPKPYFIDFFFFFVFQKPIFLKKISSNKSEFDADCYGIIYI